MKIPITVYVSPERTFTWEQWLAGRAERRALSRLVAPDGARRLESSSDKRLRAAFDGERGPKFLPDKPENQNSHGS